MSHSKVTISQSMNKIIYRHPENKSTNIPTNSHHIPQSSKTSRVLDESFQNSSKLHNTSGLEIRHFLNLLNITDEDRKNVPPKSQPKSPIKNATSFVQQSTGSITKRGSPMKKPLLNYSPDYHKSFTNRSFISYPTESMNTLQEDKSIIDPPSPTFYNPSHSILNKRASMDGDRSFTAKKSNNQNYSRTARNSLLGGLDEVHSAKKVAKASTRPPSINTISGDLKKVNTSIVMEKTSKSKESSPFQKKSPINNNNSMCSTQSMSILENIMKSFPEKGEVSGVRSSNKSPISTKQKRVSIENIVNTGYQEGFDMKSVLEDVLDFPEKVKMMHNMIPKEKYNKGSKTSHSKSPSNPRNTYNDLLNKKYGGTTQKAAMFDEPSHTNTGYKPSKQNIHGSLNEISESTILDMILNSTTTTIRTEKKKPVEDGMYRKVVSSQILDSKSFIKEVSLDVMNQIPKGILVNKSLERKPKSTQFIKENPLPQQTPKPQEKPKPQEAYKSQEPPKSQEKPKTETATRNRASTTRQKNKANGNTPKRTEYQKHLDLKESVISVDQSDDGLSLPSPLESKSMTSLVGQRRSSSTKPVERTEEKTPEAKKLTRGRSNAVAVLERSSSMRRAKKEEEMDGKCVKVRKENKEFVDLLNKISKNNHIEQIEAMFGKDEESLVKDLVEYIQNQNLTIGRARSNSYIKNMTILEKKIEEVRNKIPSLHNMFEEEEEKKNDSHADNKPASINHVPNSKEEEKSGFGKYKTKRSSFSLEAAKKIPPNTNASSINDIQNPETSNMQHMLVPPSNQQENNLSTPSLGPLSLQNLHLDRKELLKLEDSARGPETRTDINAVHNKENNILDNKTNISNKANSSDSEKRENTEVAIELPAFGRTSTLHTQESTSSSLITVAIETPPSSSKESGTLPLLDAVNDFEPKQENRLATSNIEPGLGSPSLLFSVLSGSSNNKPAMPVVIAPTNEVKESSPPRNPENKQENNNDIMLKPTLQRSEFANGSFGCLPQPVEPTQTTQDPPKFGGLGSMVFKPLLHSPAVNNENPPKQQQQQQQHGMNISMVVHLKKKLKPVYIEKLDPENLKATIYGEIQEKEHPGVSFGDLHDLFENAPVNKPTAAPAQPKKELKSLIIDGNRAQNISILAMKFRKLSANELRDAIINLDPAIMTSEACSTLLPFVPLPDEIKACQNNREPLEKLNTASQFLLSIYDIPQLGARLRSTIFKNEFKERFDTILNAINKVKTACDILKENIHFKVFLRLSLEVANTLNEGTTRGSALGLKPASLLSFDTVRSNKPGLTLLVYMAQKIFEQKPEILDFTADFGGITDATKINILDPIRGLQELKKDMNQLRLQLEMSMEKNPPDTGFSNAFKQFHDSSAPLLIEAEENINKTNEHYIETAKFLGEDDDSLKKKTSMEFFKVFKHLADTIDKFKSDEVEKRKREARRAAMKK